MIKHTFFDGVPAVQAFNEQLEITLLPGFGSQIISMVDKRSGRELLVKPKTFSELQEEPYLKGIPVLFPPNRIENGTFIFNGEVHHFPVNEAGQNHMHGFVYDKPWALTAASEENGIVRLETEITLGSPDIYSGALIQLTFELDGAVLRKKATIRNQGKKPFPFGFGYHTAFRFDESVSTFTLTAEKQWELDKNAIPTGKLTPVQPFQSADLRSVPLDDAFAAAGMENRAVMENQTTGQSIVYRTDENFKHWVVYNGSGEAGFLCPEPYTCITNAFNLNLSPETTGLLVLEPGSEKTVTAEIQVTQ